MNKLTKFSRAIFAIAMMLTMTTPSFAYSFEVDGIYYNIKDSTTNTVSVTLGDNEYSGKIIIPEYVVYNNVSYEVTSIGSAFNNCSNLTSIIIGNSVTSIGNYAFDGCTNLTSITIGSSVTEIGNTVFSDCTNLTELIFADGTTTLKLGYNYNPSGTGLFYTCPLKKLYLGRDLSYIETGTCGYSPFSKLKELNEVTISDSVTKIGKYLFYECSSLTSIVIPNSVTKIEVYAFQNCTGLTEVTIGENVANIMGYNGSYGVSAFSGCNNIKKIIWNAKNCTTYENSYQRGCQEPFGSSASMVEEVIFGDNVRNIGQNLCKGFSKVTKLTFPGTLVSVGTDAFSGCSSIQSVTSKNRYPGDISEISKIPSASPSATLIVPHNSAILYGERVGWKNFSNIIEFEDPKIYLTLKFPESGTITHKEIYEEAVDLSFKANEGWEINSITFNEEDVTAELDEDGNYTTPVLTADAILVVVFEKIDTSVEPISEKNNIKVYAYNGEVRIVGAEPQSEVSIYNSIGALVYKGNDKTIVLNGNGVYILTVEGRTFKFAM